jgi:hypothetical protein
MKHLVRLALGVTASAAVAISVASAQTVISAKSGLIHYVEGRAYLGDQQIESKFGEFPDLKENAQLRTEEGRAEVLLTPGVFLRVGDNTAIRMVTNRLIDTRVEFLSGSALVEADELLKDNGVTIVYKDYAIQLEKKGMYRFDSEPPTVRVYDGGAMVLYNGKSEEIKPSHMLEMNGELKIARFDKDKSTDELYLWSRDRSQYLAMANVAAAQSVNNSGTYYGAGNSSWAWNPFFGMYTFIPMSGTYYNPFGWAFYSPYSVYSYLNGFNGGYYYPPYAYGGGGGGGGSTPGHKPGRVGHGPVAPSRPGGVQRGITPAAAAMRSSVASNARSSGGGGFSGGSGGRSGGGFSSSSSSSSAMSSSSHSSGSFGGGGGHSSGGGGGHGK